MNNKRDSKPGAAHAPPGDPADHHSSAAASTIARLLLPLIAAAALSIAACDSPSEDPRPAELPPPRQLSDLADLDTRSRATLFRTETYVRGGYELFFDRGPDLGASLPAHTTRDIWTLTGEAGVISEIWLHIYEPDGPTLVVAHADTREAWLEVQATGRRTESWLPAPFPPGSPLETLLRTMIDNERTAIAELIASDTWERIDTPDGPLYQRPGPCNHVTTAAESLRQLHLAPDESAALESTCTTQTAGEPVTLESERTHWYSLPATAWNDLLETAGLRE